MLMAHSIRTFCLAVMVCLAIAASQIDAGGILHAQAAPSHEGRPSFHSEVDLVSLNVTLTNQKDQLVSGLTASDFTVFEDGVPQELTFFSSTRLPMDVAILLDTSSSMAGVMSVAQNAAIGLVETAQPADRVSVTEFNDRANIIHPLGGDVSAAAQAVRATWPRGSTALYNGLYLAMTEMMRSRRGLRDIRKQAVVVLSDGQDTSSLVQYDDVMALAKESGIVVYTILLLNPVEARQLNDFKTKHISQPFYVMRSLAEATGGLAYMTTNANELHGIYGRIASELAQQYTLGYVSTNARRDGGFRRVVVRLIDHPGVLARTRSGYQAPKSRPSRSLGASRATEN
jgi:Ca-activated chloride channel family protein